MYVWKFKDNGDLSLATYIQPDDKTPEMFTFEELQQDPRYIAKLDKVAEETTVAPTLKQARKRSESENPGDVVRQDD